MGGACRTRHLKIRDLIELAREVYMVSMGGLEPVDNALQLLEAARVQALIVYRKYGGSCRERRAREALQIAFEIATLEPLGGASLALALAASLRFLSGNKIDVDPDAMLEILESALARGNVEDAVEALARLV